MEQWKTRCSTVHDLEIKAKGKDGTVRKRSSFKQSYQKEKSHDIWFDLRSQYLGVCFCCFCFLFISCQLLIFHISFVLYYLCYQKGTFFLLTSHENGLTKGCVVAACSDLTEEILDELTTALSKLWQQRDWSHCQ